MRGFAIRFCLLRAGSRQKLERWIKDARRSGIYAMQRFASTLRADQVAVVFERLAYRGNLDLEIALFDHCSKVTRTSAFRPWVPSPRPVRSAALSEIRYLPGGFAAAQVPGRWRRAAGPSF
jgi:hypothetical protein